MYQIFHSSRHGTAVEVHVGIEGLEIELNDGREARQVLLTERKQFGSIIESLEHALGPYQGYHKGLNAHLVVDEKPVWLFSGTFRQHDSMGRELPTFVDGCLDITYYSEGMNSWMYIVQLRRSEAERLVAILREYCE